MLLKKCWVDPDLAGGERGGTHPSNFDPRLQVLMRGHQGVTPVGVATVSGSVSKPASVGTIRHCLPVFTETRQNSRTQTRLKPDWFLDSEKPVICISLPVPDQVGKRRSDSRHESWSAAGGLVQHQTVASKDKLPSERS